MTETYKSSPFQTGIRGLCPRCQQGYLFKGYLTLADNCEACSLDYSFADPADGPAFFSMTIAAVPALLFGIWLQTTFNYPPDNHLVLCITTAPDQRLVGMFAIYP